jgi:hypothetical protein
MSSDRCTCVQMVSVLKANVCTNVRDLLSVQFTCFVRIIYMSMYIVCFKLAVNLDLSIIIFLGHKHFS